MLTCLLQTDSKLPIRMKNLSKNFLWAIVTLITLALVFTFVNSTATPPKRINLSDLTTELAHGNVKDVQVAGDDVNVTFNDGSKAVTKKEDGTSITDTFKNYGLDPAALQKVHLEIKNPSGLETWAILLLPTLIPIVMIGFIFWLMFRQARTGANQAFNFGRAGIKLSGGPGKEKNTFEDVAGLKEAKEELVEVVEFLKTPEKFLELGAKIPRGVLLIGPPGSGKTLLARAVAGEAGVPFFYISASEFVEMFVGVGASRTRDAFATAKKAAPAILFIDEIDAVGRQRGTGMGGGNDEREQTLNQILVELDGFDNDTKLIVLAATNRPDILDTALLRPGRFDRHVVLDLPDINDREAILKIHARGKPLAEGVDLRKIAVRTPGFSGADLANLFNEAAILTARKNKKQIEQNELFESIEKVILGPERRGRAISDNERQITAYHEGGHALVASSILGADPVHKVSIVSRGMAGGYTMKLPLEERHLRTRQQFLTDIAVALGGFVSEKLTFKDVSTGASSDLKEASALARKLVTRYGMSDAMGPMTFGKTDEAVFLGRDLGTEKDYSEDTARRIDAEVRNFIDRAYEAAVKTLTKNKAALVAIATALMEKETLEQEEFNAVLAPFKIEPIAI
jgi:cell division protease FtsH